MITITMVLSSIMVENTCLKDFTSNVKRLLEMMDAYDNGYCTCFDTIESAVEEMLKRSRHMEPSSLNPPFQVCNVKLDFSRFLWI